MTGKKAAPKPEKGKGAKSEGAAKAAEKKPAIERLMAKGHDVEAEMKAVMSSGMDKCCMFKCPVTDVCFTMNRFIGLLVLVVLVALTFWVCAEQKVGESKAESVVNGLVRSVENGDLKGVEKHADINMLSSDVVDNVLLAQLDIAGGVGDAAGFGNMVASTLKKTLSEEVKAAVGAASFGFADDGEPRGLLQKMVRDFSGGSDLKVVDVKVVAEREGSFLAAVFVDRVEMGDTVLLPLKFEKIDGIWKAVKLPNLARVMDMIRQENMRKLQAANEAIIGQMNEVLQVKDLQKSAGMGVDGKGKATLLTIAFENAGEREISSFSAIAAVTDLASGHTRTFAVEDVEGVDAGGVVEKTWPFALDPVNEIDKLIYAAEPQDLKVVVRPTEIKFTNGETLRPLSVN